jgi:hypothetical protein
LGALGNRAEMHVEHTIAFAADHEETGLEIRVNFGIFAGRDATSAELEDLGKLLVPEAGAVSIIAEERHELSDGAEVVLHQVRVAVPPERVPANDAERRAFRDKLVGLAEIWARRCIHERHAGITEL